MTAIGIHYQSWRQRPEVWIAGLAFVVRFWFLCKFADSPFFEPIPGGNDRALYHGLARQVAGGHFFPTGVFEHMPLYPWLLGLIYAIFGSEIHPGQNLYVAGLFGMLVDTATVFLFVRLAGSLGAPSFAAWVTGVLYALYPTAIIYSVQTMPNTLNAFLLILFAGAALRLQPSGSRRSWWGAGLLAGVAALGFAGMLLIGLACLGYWIAIKIQNSKSRSAIAAVKIQNLLLFILGFIIPIVPVTFHNWQAEHRFVLVTAHGGFNFYMGNHANATGYPVQISEFRGEAGSLLVDARREAEKMEGRKLTAAEFSSHWSKRAWDFILGSPFQELKLLGLKFFKFWNHHEYDDLRLLPMLRLTDFAFTGPFWPGFAWIGWLGFSGLFLARGCGLLKMITVSGVMGVIAFFVTARYRLTFAPLLAVLGAAGLAEMYCIWFGLKEVYAATRQEAARGDNLMTNRVVLLMRNPYYRPALCGIFIFVIAGLLTWFPLRQTDFRALDHLNTAVNLLARGNAREALEQSKRGIALAPEEASLFFVMGNAYYTLGETTAAAASFEETIRLKPSHVSAHYNLGQVWMNLNQPAVAAKEAALALYYDPEHSNAKKLLLEAETAAQAAGTVNSSTGEKK